jgi:hypothetical protein
VDRLGMLIVAAVVPGGMAIAGTSPVTAISNLAGTRTVSLTTANQLLASESDPKQSVVITGSVTNNFKALYTVPAGKALVIKTASVIASFQPGDGVAEIGLAAGPNGTPSYFSVIELSESQGDGQTQTVDFGSQVVVPSGHDVDIYEGGASDGADAFIYGYLVPAGAAPSTFAVHGSPPKINLR